MTRPCSCTYCMNEQECTPSNWEVNPSLAHQAAVDHLSWDLARVFVSAACSYPTPQILLFNNRQPHTIQLFSYFYNIRLGPQMPRFRRNYVYGLVHIRFPNLLVLSLNLNIFNWIRCAVRCSPNSYSSCCCPLIGLAVAY